MPVHPPKRLRFGNIELDVRAGELCRDGERIRLQEKPLQVLLMLLAYPGEVVGSEQIRKKLWPNDTKVEFDLGIYAAVRRLRSALGDSADEPLYVETVGRRGYRFIAAVEPLPDLSAPADDLLPPAPPPPDSGGLIGKKVAHYRVLQVIGGGGMGVVYKAEDLKLGRRVALKFLPEEFAGDPIALQRFEREARTASSLNHPNICTIYSVQEHEGQPFIDMELLEGETLRDHLAGATPSVAMPPPDLLRIATGIANALEAAHEQGIIHRDIKPANIFLAGKGVVKVLDFGLAKLLEAHLEDEPARAVDARAAASSDTGIAPHVTRPGSALGTASYMSPEQVRGETLDARTDLFSFGLVLYQMATGQQAFSGDTAAEVQDAILHQDPPPARQVNPAISPQLENVLNKALQKDRELRYQSAADVLADLDSLLRPRRVAVGWKLRAAIAAILLVAIVGWLLVHFRPKVHLTTDDTIVLSEFTNLTHDPVLDTALQPALDISLGQTPFLNLLLPEKILEALKSMNKPGDGHLTPSLARDVCMHTNSAAYVEGSIADIGNEYEIKLAAHNCNTGTALASSSSRATERGHIIRSLDAAAYALRQRLGEGKASLQRYNQPLEEASSTSLEALQAFAAGRTQYGKPEAVASFTRAIELDSNFALAYRWLGACYNNLINRDGEIQNFTKAFELRERATVRDRLDTAVLYYIDVTGEFDKAISTLEQVTRDFPAAIRSRSNLGYVLRLMGQYERSIEAERECVRAMPDQMSPHGNLAFSYMALGRLDEAKQALEVAYAHKLDAWNLRWGSYRLAFLAKDEKGMEEQLRWAEDKLAVVDFLTREQSETEGYFGHLRHADELSRRAADQAARANAVDRGGEWLAVAALRAAKVGDMKHARDFSSQALKVSLNRRASQLTALALARIGDIDGALEIGKRLDRENPVNTLIQRCDLPTLRAQIALQQQRPEAAIEALKLVVPYELRFWDAFSLESAYVRGEAYMQAGHPDRAAAEFRKVLAYPGLVGNSINGPLARLQLARAQAMMGDQAAARDSYQQFFTLWKDADPDIFIYKKAKAEYARL
jgi:serine/threonine protein kinase/tetratricopeptide (TPR) repeat protein